MVADGDITIKKGSNVAAKTAVYGTGVPGTLPDSCAFVDNLPDDVTSDRASNIAINGFMDYIIFHDKFSVPHIEGPTTSGV